MPTNIRAKKSKPQILLVEEMESDVEEEEEFDTLELGKGRNTISQTSLSLFEPPFDLIYASQRHGN